MDGMARGGTRTRIPGRARLAGAVAAALFGAVALSGCSGDNEKLGAPGGDPFGTSGPPAAPTGDATPTKKPKTPTTEASTPATTGPTGGATGTGAAAGFPAGPGADAPKLTADVTPKQVDSPIAGVTGYTASQQHDKTSNIVYPQTPPVGGQHDPRWANCGIYRGPVPNRNGVHSMEHGAVWVTYRPDLPQDQITALETALRGKPYILLSPYPGLPSPVVASAWGLQLKLDSARDPRLGQFVTMYAQGPQTPEPGAVCDSGVGKPVM